MFKKDFVWEISRKADCSQRIVRKVFNGMIDVMEENLLKGEEIRFPGIFTIEVVDVPDVVKYSGLKNETYVCPAHKRLRFKVIRAFTEQLMKSSRSENKNEN